MWRKAGFRGIVSCGEIEALRHLAGQIQIGEDGVVVAGVDPCGLVAQDFVRAYLYAPCFVADEDPIDPSRGFVRVGRREMRTLESVEGVCVIVVLVSGGSLSGGLALHEFGLPTVGVPATIDNDIPGTELSIGVDTALNTAIMIIDRIKDTTTSHRTAMVVEVLGRDSGFLGVMSAIAGGADAVMAPEFETEPEELLDLLNESYDKGKPRFTVVVAEEFRDYVNEAGGAYAADLTVLGHIQSGGSPTTFDRILASRMRAAAVEALADEDSGTMVGLGGDEIQRIPLDDVAGEQRPLDPDLYNLAGVLSALPE